MMAQIVLITGCSSGIGLATAVLFANDPERRFTVYGTILKPLNEEKDFKNAAGAALNDTLFAVQVDVTKEDMIAKAVVMIMEKHSKIDIVVNNAGVTLLKVTETVSDSMLKQLYDVNMFGMFRVTREVLPIMKRRRSGRIINISSVNAISPLPYIGVYASSKYAIEGFSEEIAVIGRFFNVWVSLIEPGPVSTRIGENMQALNFGGPEDIRDDPNVLELDKRLSSAWFDSDRWQAAPVQSAEDVAKVVLKAATDEKPHMRYQTSQEVQNVASLRYKDTTGDSLIEYQVERLKPYKETPATKE